MRLLFLALLMVGLSGPVWAATEGKPADSAILYKNCGKSANKWADSYCHRYVLGMVESQSNHSKRYKGYAVCPPDDVTKGEIVNAVKYWLRRSPEQPNTPAERLIAMALSDSWPCH